MYEFMKISSIDFNWLTHGSLNVERANILPSFLKEGHQEVDSCTQVLSELIFGHFISTESCTKWQCIFQLESELFFKIRYLTEALTSLTLLATDSVSGMAIGNLPILVKTLPTSLGITFIRDSEAMRMSKGLHHFLIGFFSLLNFFRPS